MGTIICAAFLLPDRVDGYWTPTDRPDIPYALWQYLILVVAVAVVVAFGALSAVIIAIVEVFGPERVGDGSRVAVPVAAWVLVWFSGRVWLVIWLGQRTRREALLV